VFMEDKASEESAKDAMQEIDEITLRDRLKARHLMSFEGTRHLAIEIKLIDDQIASLTEHLATTKTNRQVRLTLDPT
jgi:hypothetical protein